MNERIYIIAGPKQTHDIELAYKRQALYVQDESNIRKMKDDGVPEDILLSWRFCDLLWADRIIAITNKNHEYDTETRCMIVFARTIGKVVQECWPENLLSENAG